MRANTSRQLSTLVEGKTLVVVSMGSNDEPYRRFISALDLLSAATGPLTIASVYQSQAVAHQQVIDEEVYYLNSVVSFWSDKNIAQLQRLLKSIEVQCGRDRASHKVAMDIDLLLYGDYQASTVAEVLPHTDILRYAYVLRPLAELLPNVCHPGLEATYAELWQAFDKQQVLQPVDFMWQDQVVSTAPSCLIM